MSTDRPSISELTTAMLTAAPSLDADEQRLVVGLYRALALGSPVSPGKLAKQLGVRKTLIEEALDRWPGVYRNEDGDIVGFWGIAVGGMPHHLEIDGQRSTAWCAIDPFLIAPLLDADQTEVRSKDPVTGETIALTITNDGVIDVSPSTAMVSMLAPDGAFDHDVVQTFCHYVWFFASPDSGEEWTSHNSGTFLLNIEEANAVARGSWPKLVQQAIGKRVA